MSRGYTAKSQTTSPCVRRALSLARRRGGIALAVGSAALLLSPPLAAAERCADGPPECSGGYIQASAGVIVPVGEKFGPDDEPKVGPTAGLGGGYFGRVGAQLGIAAGLRFGYDLYRGPTTKTHTYHVGPELRLGYAGDRVFAFGTLRGGYSHWDSTRIVRTVWAAGDENGGYIGVGGGLWGSVLGRLLIGAEVDADFILSVAWDGSVAQRVGLTLAIGAWI
ncbi:MAG: hypothetical protein H6711_31130 [Myxococcales bacterium]|nr:hypothetical protein [Myxococcales bacterium]